MTYNNVETLIEKLRNAGIKHFNEELMDGIHDMFNRDIKTYDDIYDYVKDGNFENHEWYTCNDIMDDDTVLITEFDMANDMLFTTDEEFTITVNGVKYIYVNWLEDELSFIKENFTTVTLAYTNDGDCWNYPTPYKNTDEALNDLKDDYKHIYEKSGDYLTKLK